MGEVGDDAGGEVGRDAHLERDPALRERPEKAGVVDCPDAVADAVSSDGERRSDAGGPDCFAGVWDDRQTASLSKVERRTERGQLVAFVAAEPEGDDTDCREFTRHGCGAQGVTEGEFAGMVDDDAPAEIVASTAER